MVSAFSIYRKELMSNLLGVGVSKCDTPGINVSHNLGVVIGADNAYTKDIYLRLSLYIHWSTSLFTSSEVLNIDSSYRAGNFWLEFGRQSTKHSSYKRSFGYFVEDSLRRRALSIECSLSLFFTTVPSYPKVLQLVWSSRTCGGHLSNWASSCQIVEQCPSIGNVQTRWERERCQAKESMAMELYSESTFTPVSHKKCG